MKFPLSEIDVNDYNDHIFKLLQDEETYLFIDTNIIALLYGVHDSARKEFFDWIQNYVVDGRVKLPNWVLNEYTNRFIRDKVQDYLNPLKKISTINKEFSYVSDFLKMHIDTTSLSNTGYSTLDDFKNDLEEIQKKLKVIAVAANSKNEDYRLKIHKEIEIAFGQCVIESDLDGILAKIASLGSTRYDHKLPPGFQDEKKELNSHGDLILWYEILEFCKNSSVKKAILITNDEKKDWLYAPYRIILNSRSKKNIEPKFKIVDPRLVYEFKHYTESEEFHIINFEQLTKILISKISGNFIDLAGALQISSNQDEIKKKKSEPNSKSRDTENLDEKLPEDVNNNTEIKPKEDEGKHITEEIQPIQPNLPPLVKSTETYSAVAMSDKDFPLYDDSLLTRTIEELKSYNWYRQNPAIRDFLEIDSKELNYDQETIDKLFVIGRNIYQSACGGSAVAVEFIASIDFKFRMYNDNFINHLYSGMLYEIYFDSSSQFRGNNLKSQLINPVFKTVDNPRLEPALTFIGVQLAKYRQNLLYSPAENNIVALKIIFSTELTIRTGWDKNDILEFLELTELFADDKSLLTKEKEEAFDVYFVSQNVKGLIDTICKTYAIPDSKINPTIINGTEKLHLITLKDRMFKKLILE